MKKFFSHPIVTTTVKMLISVVLIVLLISYIDFTTVIQSFQNAQILFLIIGCILAVVQLVIHFYRWRYLLRLVSKEISNDEAFTSLFVGFMAGFFTPAQLGEFAGRIASHPNVNKSHIVGITIIDKLYWMALTLVIGGAGLTMIAANYYGDYWHPAYRYIVTFAMGIVIAVFLFPEKILALFQLLPKKVRDHRFYEIMAIIEQKFHNPQAWIVFGFTALLFMIILTEYYFLILAFQEISYLDAAMCGASVLFVKAIILPVSFGDLGVRESAAIFFFEKVGTTAAVAFNASIIMSFANVIIPTAIGALLVTKLKRK